MKLFNDIEEAVDYAVEANHPIDCGVFFENDKTGGTLYTCFPSCNYKRRGMFSGLHAGQEIWNPKTHKWESAVGVSKK